MIILEVLIIAFAHYAQASGKVAFANRKRSADAQRLSVFPNRLEKQWLKLYDEGQQFGK